MFIPQAARVPATSANRRVRSRVITVRSKSWRLGRRSSCTGSLSRLRAINLDSDPVQLDLRPNRQLFDLTVITRDRTRLFADVAGTLAAWGMNIVKAGAFSNEAGVIVDSFHFSDVFRT